MRRLAAFFGFLVPLAAGCVEEPIRDEPTPLPVVTITSTFHRALPNGTAWEPAFPGYHGCPDTFAVDAGEERIRIYESERSASEVEEARAAVSALDRDPTAYYRNSDLTLPNALPYNRSFPVGNVDDLVMLLRVEADLVEFNSVPMGPGINHTHRVTYAWDQRDGTRLTVTEDITVEFVGRWQEPLVLESTRLCI